jgi:death-on-curing protein
MTPVSFLAVEDILEVHRRVIEEFGGDVGLRDRGFLESAAAMPRSAFGGRVLHPRLTGKAAAYFFHLCPNHPLVDGNKRVAVAVSELFLLVNHHELVADDKDVERLAMGVAGGKVSKDQVVRFFGVHTTKS